MKPRPPTRSFWRRALYRQALYVLIMTVVWGAGVLAFTWLIGVIVAVI